jgi:hypothetical protein
VDSPKPKSNTVDRESIRLLAIEFGVREAARRSGLNESTVKSWSSRGKWFTTAPVQAFNAPAIRQASNASKAGDVLLTELREHDRQTKLSLARSASRMAKDAEQANLRDSGHVHEVAKTAAIVHRWNQPQDAGILNVKVLAGGKAAFQVNQRGD